MDYIDAWKKFDGAGTHLLDSLQNAVKGTAYDNLGQETSKAFRLVHIGNNGLDPIAKLREMENLLLGLKNQSGENIDCSHSNLQILCRCFLLFLKVQLDYHQMCSATIASLLSILVQTSECSDNKDVLLQMSNLDLIPPSPRQSPSRSNSRKKQTQGSFSPKLPPKQNTLKSSFFSLFERKSSPDESTSSFYVDLTNPEPVENTKAESKESVVVTSDSDFVQEGIKTGILVQIEPDEDLSTHKPENVHISDEGMSLSKSPLASAEEIDSVINLLSACSVQPKHMETIHENHLTVPNIYMSRTPSPGSSDDMRPSKVPTQRHSEGSLDFSGMGGVGRNTWPHRSSLPSVALSSQMNYQDMLGFGVTMPRRYSQELNRPNPNFLSPQPSSSALANQGWSYPDYKYGNRTWPISNMAAQCSDTMKSSNSSWSAIQDSDDLSDDSSCGEQFFAVGLDLVHAMDSKHGSSDDESEKQKDASSKAWPQKQGWPSTNQPQVPGSGDQARNQSHRPLSMQWSDPLANRNMWPSGAGMSFEK